jgi:hypothetical protein
MGVPGKLVRGGAVGKGLVVLEKYYKDVSLDGAGKEEELGEYSGPTGGMLNFFWGALYEKAGWAIWLHPLALLR